MGEKKSYLQYIQDYVSTVHSAVIQENSTKTKLLFRKHFLAVYDVNLRVHLPCERSSILVLVILDHGSKFCATIIHTSHLPCGGLPDIHSWSGSPWATGCLLEWHVAVFVWHGFCFWEDGRQKSLNWDSVLHSWLAVMPCLLLQTHKSDFTSWYRQNVTSEVDSVVIKSWIINIAFGFCMPGTNYCPCYC